MKLNPYLAFNGNCEDAIDFYKDILDANVSTFMRFEDAPPNVMKVPDTMKKLVMHATLEFKGNTLMMCDNMKADFSGNFFSLSINSDEEAAYTIFQCLLNGGKEIMPFAEAFWGGKFGMLVDKFGIQWMLTSEHKPD